MATRTISNAGGNYNAVGTWVEGIVPTSADDVVATATSGQLTVNVSSAARSCNFTNYTNTLTMNSTWTVSGVATQTFVSGMTISGTGLITLTGTAADITTNGKVIPNLSITGNKTLNDTLNVVNFTSGAANFTSNSINCSGNWSSSFFAIGGSSIINLTGTGTISFGSYTGTGGLNLNTSGTLSGSTIGIGLGANTTLNYSGGTLFQMKLKLVTTPITINGNGVEFETFDMLHGVSTTNTLNIPTELKVKYFNTTTTSTSFDSSAAPTQLTIAGAGALNVTQSMNICTSIVNNAGIMSYKPGSIAFQTGVTHTINSLVIAGFNGITTNTSSSASNAKFKSSSAGNRADINLVNPTQSIIANTDVTDINFTGAAVYTLLSGGTISNSLNVTNTSIGANTGATATTAFTFVN